MIHYRQIRKLNYNINPIKIGTTHIGKRCPLHVRVTFQKGAPCMDTTTTTGNLPL